MNPTVVGTPSRTVEEWMPLLPGLRHPQRSTCPGCHADLARVGLIDLAYVFTVCNDRHVEYDHLYEQVWHLACLKREAVR